MSSILTKVEDIEWTPGRGLTPRMVEAINANFDVIFRDLSLLGIVTRGDLIAGDEDEQWNVLPIGASGTVLTSDGTDPSWSSGPFTFSSLTITGDLTVGDDVAIASDLTVDGSIEMTDVALGACQLVIGTTLAAVPTSALTARVYVLGNTSGGANLDLRAANTTTPATVEVQASDYETSFQSAYLQYIGSGIAGNIYGSIPRADLVILAAQNAANVLIDSSNTAPIIFGINAAEVARFTTAAFTVVNAVAISSTAAAALDVAGGAQFGSGNVALIGTDGRINGPLSSTIIDDLSGANLTNLPAAAITGTLALANGGTGADLSATGGANQFLRQSSAGAVVTVSAIADADVPNNITIDGTNNVTWGSVNKTGSSLADLATRSASDLSSGTLPDARFPATLPAASGINLTGLVEANITDGTILARVASNETISGTWTFNNALAWGGGLAITSSDNVLTDG
jgi:hypothetical protein